MAKRVKKRVGNKGLRAAEVTGVLLAILGAASLVHAFDAGGRGSITPHDDLLQVVAASLAVLFGVLLALRARDADTQWLCSKCQQQLRRKDDAACLNCMVLLD